MSKIFYLNLTSLLFCTTIIAQTSKPPLQVSQKVTPKTGFFTNEDLVPDQQTAVKIAEAIWFPIYGTPVLSEKPYVAKLKEGIWYVNGTLKETKGGVAYIEINKKDCRIINVYHTK